MRLDDLGSAAGDWAREHGASSSPPDLDTVRTRRRRRGALSGAVLGFAATLVVVGGVVLAGSGGGSAPVASTSPGTTTSTNVPPSTTTTFDAPPDEPAAFTPPVEVEGGTQTIRLTLLDGTRLVVALPDDLDVTSEATELNVVGRLGEGAYRQLAVEAGGVDDVLARREWAGEVERLRVYADLRGGGVELWRLDESGTAGGGLLLFPFDGWTAILPEPPDGDRDDARGEWARGLYGTTDTDGFLLISGLGRVEVVPAAGDPPVDGPDLMLHGTSGSLGIYAGECRNRTRLDEETYEPPGFGWCHEPSDTLLIAFGDSEFNRRMHETLDVLEVTPPDPPEPSDPDPVVGQCGLGSYPDGWERDAARIGPLWLWPHGGFGGGDESDPAVKSSAILEPWGLAVTIRAPENGDVALLFDASTWNTGGAYRVGRDGHRSQTFAPGDDCAAESIGGFVYTGSACEELEVAIGSAPPVLARVPLLPGACGDPIEPSVEGEPVTAITISPCSATSPNIIAGGADALPPAGSTDRDVVESVLIASADELARTYGATAAQIEVQIVQRNGQVWTGPGNGVYEVEWAQDFQIEVVLDSVEACPGSPVFWQGIPLLFTVAGQ